MNENNEIKNINELYNHLKNTKDYKIFSTEDVFQIEKIDLYISLYTSEKKINNNLFLILLYKIVSEKVKKTSRSYELNELTSFLNKYENFEEIAIKKWLRHSFELIDNPEFIYEYDFYLSRIHI